MLSNGSEGAIEASAVTRFFTTLLCFDISRLKIPKLRYHTKKKLSCRTVNAVPKRGPLQLCGRHPAVTSYNSYSNLLQYYL